MRKGIMKGHKRSLPTAADDQPHEYAPPTPAAAPWQRQTLAGEYTDPKLCLAGVRSRLGLCDA
jgi:hypothetical protein